MTKRLQLMTIRQRLLKYLVYIGLSIFYPFLVMIISIALTGDRLHGMAIGLGIAFISLNIFYGFYFLKSTLAVNSICGIIVTIISIGLVYLQNTYEFELKDDTYGLYSGLLVYGLSSLISWELSYQVLRKITTR